MSIEMRTIIQKDSTGCGIACISMLVDKPYNEVKEKMKLLNCFDTRGYRTNCSDLKKALRYYKKKYSKEKYKKIDWESLKKDAIVEIKYNKKKDTSHWVVFDKEKKCVRNPETKSKKKNPINRLSDKTVKSWKMQSYMYVGS